MAKLLILGAGGHGKVVAEIASMSGKWDQLSFLDDNEAINEVNEIPVIGKLQDAIRLRDEYKYAFVAIGNNNLRLKWLDYLIKAGFLIPVLIHPHSVISTTSLIDQGTVVMAGTVINSSTQIKKGSIINTASSVDHDCIIEEGVHISPGVHVGGTVTIGICSWICIGANIVNNIKIGHHVIVAAGATVINDISDSIMVAGTPAMEIKKLNKGDSNE